MKANAMQAFVVDVRYAHPCKTDCRRFELLASNVQSAICEVMADQDHEEFGAISQVHVYTPGSIILKRPSP